MLSLPRRARVLYSTATAATEVKHMAYMERLGLWGAGLPYNLRGPERSCQVRSSGFV